MRHALGRRKEPFPGVAVDRCRGCYFLARDLGPDVEASFLESFSAGQLILAKLTERDITRMVELVRKYADLTKSGIGGADASVVALAERLRITEVATIDRRHFQVIRPAHCSAFTLLPEL